MGGKARNWMHWFVFFLFWQMSFPGMVCPIVTAPIRLSLQNVDVHAGHEVLIEVDNSILLIVGNPQWGFRPAAQASPITLFKFYYYMK
jgi:hypothetical protein